MTAWFETALAASPVMGVFRGASPARSVQLAEWAWDAGAELVEIPIETRDALPSLRAVIAAGRERDRIVGAGTILDAGQLSEAAGAGAGFLVSPSFDLVLAGESLAAGLPFLPGVATATELQRARESGLTALKAFPASVLGPEWFAAMKGPFPGVSLVATGGVDHRNAAAFVAAGASMVGVGGAFGDAEAREVLSELIRGSLVAP